MASLGKDKGGAVAPPLTFKAHFIYLVEIVKTTEIGICVFAAFLLNCHCFTASCAASARMAGPPKTCRL